MERLAEQALNALSTYANRRRQIESDLEVWRGPAFDGGAGDDVELEILLGDFKDLLTRHASDDRHTRRQLDGRRDPITGDAELQLMRLVNASTGAYQDRRVLSVLNELRERRGMKSHDLAAFKKRRQRWTRGLNSPTASKSK
jgi:hypothetical protein